MDIAAPNVGIELLSRVTPEQVSVDFPERFQLPPDGDSVAIHLNALFEVRPSERLMLELARPDVNEQALLRPSFYRHIYQKTLEDLVNLYQEQGSSNLKEAVDLMQNTVEDQVWLSMALNLLIKV